jgi:hypothetical protein
MMQGFSELIQGIRIRPGVKKPVGKGNDADIPLPGYVEAGSGKAGMAAAFGVEFPCLPAETPARGLFLLGLDKKGLLRFQVKTAEPFAGRGVGKDPRVARDALKKIMGVPVVDLPPDGFVGAPV